MRSYICYHATIIRRRRRQQTQMVTINLIAAIHNRGSQRFVPEQYIDNVTEQFYSGKFLL